MNIVLRKVMPDDFSLLHELASKCEPLDIHTPYTYWVITHYYADFCFILEDDDKPVGFITALLNDKCGFIWQIGILQDYRGKKLSSKLIDSVFRRFIKEDVHLIQVTIAPDNESSYHAFSRYCNAKEYSFQRLSNELIKDGDTVHTETVYQISI